MKFIVDMPLSPALAAWLVDRGHDAVHALTIGLAEASDETILSHAKREGRTVITADLDYPRLLAATQAAEPGVILFRDGDWNEHDVVARMKEVLATLTEADIAQSIVVIERERIRRRRLPLKQ